MFPAPGHSPIGPVLNERKAKRPPPERFMPIEERHAASSTRI
jgi:hypothetical protein